MRFKKWKRKLKKGALVTLSAVLVLGVFGAGCLGGIETRAAGGFSDDGKSALLSLTSIMLCVKCPLESFS